MSIGTISKATINLHEANKLRGGYYFVKEAGGGIYVVQKSKDVVTGENYWFMPNGCSYEFLPAYVIAINPLPIVAPGDTFITIDPEA